MGSLRPLSVVSRSSHPAGKNCTYSSQDSTTERNVAPCMFPWAVFVNRTVG